jgi:hypothetical protein
MQWNIPKPVVSGADDIGRQAKKAIPLQIAFKIHANNPNALIPQRAHHLPEATGKPRLPNLPLLKVSALNPELPLLKHKTKQSADLLTTELAGLIVQAGCLFSGCHFQLYV